MKDFSTQFTTNDKIYNFFYCQFQKANWLSKVSAFFCFFFFWLIKKKKNGLQFNQDLIKPGYN